MRGNSVQVHERFFGESDEAQDVRKHLEAERRRVLAGCSIAFTTAAAWYQHERDTAEQASGSSQNVACDLLQTLQPVKLYQFT